MALAFPVDVLKVIDVTRAHRLFSRLQSRTDIEYDRALSGTGRQLFSFAHGYMTMRVISDIPHFFPSLFYSLGRW